PPSSLEALSVPYAEALRWLARQSEGDVADVERGEASEPRWTRGTALRWCGADNERTGIVGGKGDRLRPGDLIVVPATRGGCDRWGWNPGSKVAVRDLGQEANIQHRGRAIHRLAPGLIVAQLSEDGDPEAARRLAAERRELLDELSSATDRE